MSAPAKLDLKYTVYDRANGIYLYQRAVPELAAPLLARKKLTISLGKTPHEARTRYLPTHTKWENAIQRAIASVVGEPDDDEFSDRVVEFLNAQAAIAGGVLPDIDWCLNGGQRSDLFDKWRQWNLVKGTDIGLLFDGNNDDDLDRIVDGWRIFKAAHRSRIALSAQLPAPLTDSHTPTQDGQIVLSLEELRLKWEGERKRSAASKGDVRNMVRLFVATCDNLPVHEINPSHRMAFRDAVQRITGRWGRPLKAQSRNKLMRALQGLGSYAEGLGVVTTNVLRFRPFEVTEETQREPFTDDDLTKLFKSEAWANRSAKYADFILWFFRIGAYTGARIGEIAQLGAADVFEHHGTWVFRFTFDDEDGGKQSKTRQIKIVPVAEQLIRWGFLKFVESRKGGRLFPGVKPNKDGNWSAYVSPKVNDMLRKAGFPKEYVAHSWRHTLATRLRGKAEDSVVQRITHPPKSGGSVWHQYGDVEIEEMRKALNKLTYKVAWPKS